MESRTFLPRIYITDVKPIIPFIGSEETLVHGEIQSPLLKKVAMVPFLGSLGGITRTAFSAIHSIAHLFAALGCYALGKNKYDIMGHLAHAAHGGMEMIVGLIETIPIVGCIYAWLSRNWFFLIKIEDPISSNYTRNTGLFSIRLYSDLYSPKKLLQTKQTIEQHLHEEEQMLQILDSLYEIAWSTTEESLHQEILEQVSQIVNRNQANLQISLRSLRILQRIPPSNASYQLFNNIFTNHGQNSVVLKNTLNFFATVARHNGNLRQQACDDFILIANSILARRIIDDRFAILLNNGLETIMMLNGQFLNQMWSTLLAITRNAVGEHRAVMMECLVRIRGRCIGLHVELTQIAFTAFRNASILPVPSSELLYIRRRLEIPQDLLSRLPQQRVPQDAVQRVAAHTQNVHVAAVHSLVSESLKKLEGRYLPTRTPERQIIGMENEKLRYYLFDDELAFHDLLSEKDIIALKGIRPLIQGFKKEEFESLGLSSKFELFSKYRQDLKNARLEYTRMTEATDDNVEMGTNFNFRKVLALVWMAIHDDSAYPVGESDKASRRRQFIADCSATHIAYGIGHEPTCIPGTFNKLVDTLSSLHHVDVKVNLITSDIVQETVPNYIALTLDSLLYEKEILKQELESITEPGKLSEFYKDWKQKPEIEREDSKLFEFYERWKKNTDDYLKSLGAKIDSRGVVVGSKTIVLEASRYEALFDLNAMIDKLEELLKEVPSAA